jgi:hypothetical protein
MNLSNWYKLLVGSLAMSLVAAEYKVTSAAMKETADHLAACKAEFGTDATVADFKDDLKAMSKADLSAMLKTNNIGLTGTTNVFVTVKGKKIWNDKRVYFVSNFEAKGPPSSYLEHENLYYSGTERLSVGSWYDLNYKVLCKAPELTVKKTNAQYKVTSAAVKETADHLAACKAEFGTDATVADFKDDLKAMSQADLSAMLKTNNIGLKGTTDVFVTVGGKKIWNDKRVYFVSNFEAKGPPSTYFEHENLYYSGTERLSVGSWYGLNYKVLCKAPELTVKKTNAPSNTPTNNPTRAPTTDAPAAPAPITRPTNPVTTSGGSGTSPIF